MSPLKDGSVVDKNAIDATFENEDEFNHTDSSSIVQINKNDIGGKENRNNEVSTELETPNWYSSKNVHEKSLEDQSGHISRWLLLYLSPVLRLGATRVLQPEDVGVPSDQDRAELAYDAISAQWSTQVDRMNVINEARRLKYDRKLSKMSEARKLKAKPMVERKPGLATAVVKAFGVLSFVYAMILYFLSAILQFIPVLIMEDLIKFFEKGGTTENYDGYAHPWVEVAALGVIPFFISLLQTRSQTIFLHAATYLRTGISTMLYKKSLSISPSGRAATSTGQVVNMMSTDTTQIQRFIQFLGMFLVAPVQIIISLVLIYQQVGNATWVGVGFMVILAPVNIVVFSIVGKMRRRVLKYSDLRVKMMNEILNGIRIIKYYAWEKPSRNEIEKLREEELKALTTLAYVSGIGFSLILLSAPIIQPILVFLTYIYVSDEPLSASRAFTTVALFNIMRFPFAFMPMGLLQYIQSKISVRRITRYLLLPELSEYVIASPHPSYVADPNSPEAQIGSITMRGCSFSWVDQEAKIEPVQPKSKKSKKSRKGSGTLSNSSNHSYASSLSSKTSVNGEDVDDEVNIATLRNLTVTIKKGELVAVVGSVGSGKSSLLSAMLGEMEPLEQSKVYIPRESGSELDTGFMSYCTQTPWIVNESLRGNIIFGREFRQERYDKIVEACALVEDFAILPAGDMTEIGERGINLSGGQKARISLARALYMADKTTKAVLLDDPLSAVDAHVGEHLFQRAITGEISKGTTRILVTHHVHVLSQCDTVIVMEAGEIKHMGKYSDLIEQGVDFAGAVDISKVEDEKSNEEDVNDDEKVEKTAEIAVSKNVKPSTAEVKKGTELTTKEERAEGSVDGHAYVHYANAGGWLYFVAMFAIQALGRGAEISAAFWLAYWAKKTMEAKNSDAPLTNTETFYYLNYYALFSLLGVAGLTVRAFLMAVHRLHASRKLHNDLVQSIVRAPVSFFDVTPTGRILNRFAADMDKIDLQLTQSIGQGMGTIFSVLGALAAIIAATKGTFLAPLVPISCVYYVIQKWFRKTSTELQRLNSVANSPIFADFSQVLSGTSTIRAFDEENRFFLNCQNSFDKMNSSFNLVNLCNQWLGLRLDFLGGLIGAFVAGVAVATAKSNFIPAGWLGLALSYSIEITGFLKHGVRVIATVEADMSSVERVLYYTNKIEPEAPDVIPEKDPDAGTWPSEGCIKIKGASMRYRDGPLVLKGINVTFNGGEKVGVVGRTGSGKSSLMNLLFRVTELEEDGGTIEIDGINTALIGTDALRLNLSIIPQDPVMFSNTVRYNLDPFGFATENELWSVLEKVQLGELIAALPCGLDEQVAEGGENFSQGQRQLLCIGRSILRKPKVLVMDEATASIDNSTDAIIQSMIRENFKDATVLTIAHRLNTIMDSDRVLVLDDGVIVEFDTPKNLLSKAEGYFKSMVEKSKAAQNK
uniref:ATP-dependent transporter ycf16 n=1 Tax=Eucampia antarctica TaxID=49252 RepID=A0A7S2SAV0_9STRA|mmetsp:Transcript_4830/g.4552  ORF Transcript_4830/g.4552 Transcript_4830/m.4552 type:complete len:1442 (+) Transcript_4830:204-4529(+)|eukprot:CAMPEP_0197826494 /NCGR_PEP_ID=MMETSP1437-20131217/3447_1 /TAXON_ID=49252 ORGANISM="Eucampia antarctica, Strain CCMP1452" /NCGR_SAMPLE_ID=MMETSP1437 /ASSEMBLY_ACC=CAM_ASM_001096 /LENGTH=1441 /DNA_ID=CAMNT_0043426965 /DNA_START=202 /DNA_END=4527 /DNA_ORIENTATION=+